MHRNTMRRSMDMSSVLSSDDLADYDIISDGHRSLESSIADLGLVERTSSELHEPPPSQAAREQFGTPSLTPEDIQAYVRRSLQPTGRRLAEDGRVVRVYVDGLFDPMSAGCALRLRQAKLAFSEVHLMVGVFSDKWCEQHGRSVRIPHIERCELVRHCRWVDEVVPEAPWRLDEVFLRAKRIDYVAIDEGASVSPAYDKERVKGYDIVKSLNMAIPTRPTTGLAPSAPPSAPATPDLRTSSRDIPAGMGTVRSVPTLRKETIRITTSADTKDSPFEEPLVDLFS